MPKLRAMAGNTKGEILSGEQLADELRSQSIPVLENEKQTVQQQRISLGLQRDYADIYRQKFTYPKPLNVQTALEKAVDQIGGNSFVQAKNLVERLEFFESKAVHALEYLKKETRGFKTLLPHHIKRRQYLSSELSKRRHSLNEALTGYNSKVDVLNRPENQERIKIKAEELLKEDTKIQIKRLQVEKRFETLTQSLKRTYKLEGQYRELGNEKIPVKRIEVQTSGQKLHIPIPENQQAFDQKLAAIRHTRSLSVTKLMSR